MDCAAFVADPVDGARRRLEAMVGSFGRATRLAELVESIA